MEDERKGNTLAISFSMEFDPYNVDELNRVHHELCNTLAGSFGYVADRIFVTPMDCDNEAKTMGFIAYFDSVHLSDGLKVEVL